jgi:hypothetical protein
MVWELDGRFDRPICKGKISNESNLSIEVSKIIHSYIKMNEVEDIKFNVMALAPNYIFTDELSS